MKDVIGIEFEIYNGKPMTSFEEHIYSEHLDPDKAIREINYRAGYKAAQDKMCKSVFDKCNSIEHEVILNDFDDDTALIVLNYLQDIKAVMSEELKE